VHYTNVCIHWLPPVSLDVVHLTLNSDFGALWPAASFLDLQPWHVRWLVHHRVNARYCHCEIMFLSATTTVHCQQGRLLLLSACNSALSTALCTALHLGICVICCTTSLIYCPSRQVTVSDRSFLTARPRLWNSLPEDVQSASTLTIFSRTT